MTMNTYTLFNLCILSLAFDLLILTATVSSQKYSSMHKDYFLIKEQKTFDEAERLCKSRGQRLVEIKHNAENEFVWTIRKSAGDWIWLGATNIIGTNKFKWLSDGSYVDSHYTNWNPSRPVIQGNWRKAIAMTATWYDFPVSSTCLVVCERVKVLDLQSELTENTDQSNAKFEQLDSTVQQQKDINRKLEAQVNDMSTELEFQKQVINRLNTNNVRLDEESKNLKIRVNCNEITCNEKIISLKKDNDLLERRLNRLEQKMSSNILDNSNKLE